ncbi:2-oxoglutarate-dependent dioxygenase 19-like [Lolium rigidum]|uniref:2-oxoglutarate-dependent dioxygenase 19-like n=1 Tax=Lolium rigidum TaxID=89674 RepID=UPI001F5DDDA1|nr:2-oxoglutarate-dependent dioxygenase 19-like [Lolium rigidum]
MSRPDLPDNQEKGDSAGTWSEDRIPVVDLDVLVNGDAAQRSEAIRHLGRACEEWGFFMVINHGVPGSLQGATMDACKEMFGLPAEENAEYMNPTLMAPVSLGTSLNSAYWRNYVKFFTHPDFHCPEKPANLRGNVTEYATRTRGLMLALTAAISESMGLADGRIAEALNLEDCFQLVVWNQYPPAGPEVGLPPHTDHGLLALLFQTGVDGLQVQKNGRWILAKPIPNSYFVIAGDQLEIVSNGRYKAALHRAMVHGEQARMSSVCLLGPCLDTVVQPIPELALQGVEFRGVKYRDYIEHQRTKTVNESAAVVVARAQREILARQGSPNNPEINA